MADITAIDARSDTIILGIDPGLQITGYGLIAGKAGSIAFLEAGTVEGGKAGLSVASRLRNLYLGITSLVVEYRPEAVAMEQIYSHYAHPQTAILMGHARGVLNLAAAMHEIEVFDYSATEVKASLTGNGRAAKPQIQRAIRYALSLDREPEPPDVADALAVALCHLYRQNRN